MGSKSPVKDFFTFILGGVLLSMGTFLFFNQVMVGTNPYGGGLRQGLGRSWGGGFGGGYGSGLAAAGAGGSAFPEGWATASACCSSR